jgi:hypothetical protein
MNLLLEYENCGLLVDDMAARSALHVGREFMSMIALEPSDKISLRQGAELCHSSI